jgi:hypothetical protein
MDYEYFKYPRTLHLPWSPGISNDDKVLESVEHLLGKPLVLTVKMDGECTTMYPDYIHARSINSTDHISRHWVKKLHQQIKYRIPSGWRICGENLYAKHSIYYDDLSSYFLVFSIWNDNNYCLSWSDTISMTKDLGLFTVPVLSEFCINSEETLYEYTNSEFANLDGIHEGYVVRLCDSFSYYDFSKSIAKYVRTSHVQTRDHWMYKSLTINKLANR